MMAATIALVAAAVSSPALAPVQIPFVPPVDRALRLTQVQERIKNRQTLRFEIDRTFRFARAEGGGYRLHVVIHAVRTTAPGVQGKAFRAAMTPLIGFDQVFIVDARGLLTTIENCDMVWTRFLAGQQDMARQLLTMPDRQATARAVRDMLENAGPADRIALLAADIRPLLLFAGAGRNTAPARLVATTASTADFVERSDVPGRTILIRYSVDRTTGLVRTIDRHVDVAGVVLHETKMLRQ